MPTLRCAPVLLLLLLRAAAQTPPSDGAAKMAAWKKLEAESLPAIEKLVAGNPCVNQATIAARLEETRNAAKEYFAASLRGIDQGRESTANDVAQLQKSWSEVKARRGDLPGTVALMEASLQEYRKAGAGLPPRDEEGRLVYQRLSQGIEHSLASLREAAADAQAADRFAQIAIEFLTNRADGAAKQRQLLELERQVIELKYDGVLQQAQVACVEQRAPQVLRQLDAPVAPSTQDPLSGSWAFKGTTDPSLPAWVTVQVQAIGSRVEATVRAGGIPRRWRLPVTLDLKLSGLRGAKLAWSSSGQAGAIELIPSSDSLELVWTSQEGVLFNQLLKRQ